MINRVYWNDLNLTIESTPIDITCLPGTVIDREWKKKCSCGQNIYWEQNGEDWNLVGTKLVVEQRWAGDDYDWDEYDVDVYYCLGCDDEIIPGEKSDGRGFFREFIAGPTHRYLNGVEITEGEAENIIKIMAAKA